MSKAITRRRPEAAYEYFIEAIKLETDDCILWPHDTYKDGYGRLWHEGKNYRAHRLALIQKTGVTPDVKTLALHSCRNRGCFNTRHLRWGTYQENAEDAIKDGTTTRGVTNRNSKLRPDQALQIYSDPREHKVIAKAYGVSKGCVDRIKYGETWSWLTGHKLQEDKQP